MEVMAITWYKSGLHKYHKLSFEFDHNNYVCTKGVQGLMLQL